MAAGDGCGVWLQAEPFSSVFSSDRSLRESSLYLQTNKAFRYEGKSPDLRDDPRFYPFESDLRPSNALSSDHQYWKPDFWDNFSIISINRIIRILIRLPMTICHFQSLKPSDQQVYLPGIDNGGLVNT